LNEVILGWENDWQHYHNQAGPRSPDGSLLKPSTWTGGVIFPNNLTEIGGTTLPYVSINGGFDVPSPGISMNTSLNGINTYHPSGTLKDNVIYSVGKMNMKMGIYILDSHATDYNSAGAVPQGNFSFTNSGPLTTGNAMADMELGKIASYAEGSPIVGGTAIGGWGLVRDRMKSFEPYFQDDWKVTRRLTLNLGLRWQYRWDLTEGSHPTRATDFYPTLYSRTAAAQLASNATLIPGSGENYTTYGNGLVECGTNGTPVGCIEPYYKALAPRFGFAWDPKGDGKTAIRGGFGIFYDVGYGHTPGAVASAGGPPTTLSPSLSNINGYESISGGVIGAVSFNAWDPKERRPLIDNYNFTVEHEFAGNNVFTLAYVGMVSRRLDASRNINQVPFGESIMNVPSLAGTTGCDSSGNCNVQSILINNQHPKTFFVPYLDFSQIRFLDDTATANYNSLQFTYRHTVGHGLTVAGMFTWEHTLDVVTDGTNSVATDYYQDLERWYGNSDNDRGKIIQASYVYDIPFLRNNPNHFLRNGIGGWTLSGITSFFTGLPVDISCTEAGTQTGIANAGRCNTIAPYTIDKGVIADPRYGNVPQWFNPASIAMNQASQMPANGEAGMFGYMARNALHGPGRNNFDIALLKNWAVPWFNGEHSTLQFRFETYNTFNHAQWKTFTDSCASTTGFGNPCNGSANLGNGEVASDWNPRQIQVGMKFLF
jgi:hypothetical protein